MRQPFILPGLWFALVLGCSLPAAGQTVATPTFSPSPTKFAREIRITISCATKDATLRYTLNGYDPTNSSPEYRGQLTLTQSTTVKVRGFKAGMNDSAVATGVYQQIVATPKFSVSPGTTFDDPLTVKIECETSGAKIRYTLNGYDPTGSSPEYKGPLTILETVTLKARAFKDKMADSAVATAKYTQRDPFVTPVMFDPRPDTVYAESVQVKLECKTPKSVIHYTTNGSDPTPSSPEYKDRITLTQNTTIKARAYREGKKESPVTTANYKVKVAAPECKPGKGTIFNDPLKVTMTCKTPRAEIRYVIGSGEPTRSSTLYKEPVELIDTVTLKARAYADKMEPSDLVSIEYKESFPDLPLVQFKTGILETMYFEEREVVELSINFPSKDVNIHYTLDGSDPTLNSPIYKYGILITQSCMIKARAFKHGKTPSPVVKAIYVKKEQVKQPSFDPAPGTYKFTTDVTLKCDTEGAEIRYTINGTEPTKYSTVYEGRPIMVQWDSTIRARAFKRNYIDSEEAKGTYLIRRVIKR